MRNIIIFKNNAIDLSEGYASLYYHVLIIMICVQNNSDKFVFVLVHGGCLPFKSMQTNLELDTAFSKNLHLHLILFRSSCERNNIRLCLSA